MDFGKLCELVEKKYPDVMVYVGIAEPGYDDVIALSADWNNKDLERLIRWADKRKDVEYVWSDEWANCSDCGKLVRISPCSYDWEPFFTVFECGGLMCHNCISPWGIIEAYKNNTRKAISSWMIKTIVGLGFRCIDEMLMEPECKIYQTGWHSHMTDDPEETLKKYNDATGMLEVYDYIFAITDRGQFHISWTIYVREKLGD